MLKIIINADDFGYSRAVNYGIIDAHTQGILTSTTLMTNMKGAQHAYELAHKYKTLGVGIHLTLTCGRPLLEGHKTLVDVDGNFKKQDTYRQNFYVDLEEVYREWKTQIESFLSSGLVPTHLDSHHHMNSIEQLLPIFKKLAKEYNLPVRNNFELENSELISTEAFEYEPKILSKGPNAILEKYTGISTLEIMCHPAYLDQFIMGNSSYLTPRLEELDMLTCPSIKNGFLNHDVIELISYRDLDLNK